MTAEGASLRPPPHFDFLSCESLLPLNQTSETSEDIMGGGNGQKSATARARKQEKDKKMKGGVSQLAVNQKAMSIVCQICRSNFMCTSTETKLKEHSDNKHPKNTFAECFPDFGKE